MLESGKLENTRNSNLS